MLPNKTMERTREQRSTLSVVALDGDTIEILHNGRSERIRLISNCKSHIYHPPDCPNYSQFAPRNRVAFSSAAAAEEAGYRVAGNCP